MVQVEKCQSFSYLTSWESDENLYLGGSSDKFGAQFTGSLMEFRMWNQPLTESAFDNHVKSPQSINGNHVPFLYRFKH